MIGGDENIKLPVDRREKLRQLVLTAYQIWDEAWPEIQKQVEKRGIRIQCRPDCTPCCYARKFCTLSEGLAILSYINENFPSEQQEQLRLRIESSVSSIKKLRADGCCETDDVYYKAGGVECPFLSEGKCSVYPVRPITCRALNVPTGVNRINCGQCPLAANLIESEVKRAEIQSDLCEKENRITASPFIYSRALLSDVVSYLWKAEPPPSVFFSPEALKRRSDTADSRHDHTWQDDREDFQSLRLPLSLPPEGDYPPDLTLVQRPLEVHQLYDRQIPGHGLPDFYTLYKRLPGCTFDWTAREFRSPQTAEPSGAFTIRISDSLQERCMTWEAAKRSRGRVLCGGLGLGLYPQFALSLPRVDSIDIVERDPHLIALVQETWTKNPWSKMKRCRVIEATIEDYLGETDRKYDTVYLTTWDSTYHEHLPHLNFLAAEAERVLKPKGEVLLRTYDIMVQSFLKMAKTVLEQKEEYLKAEPEKLANIAKLYPLFYQLVRRLREHPDSSSEDIMSEAHRLATQERRNLGSTTLTGRQDAEPSP